MTYAVHYRVAEASEIKKIYVSARSKAQAYNEAAYIAIPKAEGTFPYSAWVASVTYQNGNYRKFNTCEGITY